MIDLWQYYEYAFDSEYARVLNMLGSHMILNKILHKRYLAGFGNMPRILNMPVSHTVIWKTANHIPRVLNMLGIEYT